MRYGIIAQPIIGYSFEDQVQCQRSDAPVSDSENLNKVLIKVLQKSIISDKQPHGLANTKENWFCVPKSGHEDYFDIGCQWFFVPVMTLNEALWGWKSGQPHKVMVLAGDLRISESDYSAQPHTSLIHNKALDNENSCILKRSEIEKAATFLQDFVTALADMATGRGCNAAATR